MDTTKEYIKMCEKTGEIQGGFQSLHDTINHPHNLYVDKDTYKTTSPFYNYKHRNNIFLPRQDQLQEMVKSCFIDYIRDTKFNSTIFMLQKFNEFCNNKNEDCFSLERYWLEFTMKERYNKTWNGKDWERIK